MMIVPLLAALVLVFAVLCLRQSILLRRSWRREARYAELLGAELAKSNPARLTKLEEG